MNFVAHQLADGSNFRSPTIGDVYTLDALAIDFGPTNAPLRANIYKNTGRSELRLESQDKSENCMTLLTIELKLFILLAAAIQRKGILPAAPVT